MAITANKSDCSIAPFVLADGKYTTVVHTKCFESEEPNRFAMGVQYTKIEAIKYAIEAFNTPFVVGQVKISLMLNLLATVVIGTESFVGGKIVVGK
ncbi:unnamed protein product [[Candida] boidinii]|nr:unnamed protein product [[Candida] boidinii]